LFEYLLTILGETQERPIRTLIVLADDYDALDDEFPNEFAESPKRRVGQCGRRWPP